MKLHWVLLLLGAPAWAQQQVKPYIIFDFDTSLSMNWPTCNGNQDIDHTLDCPGVDVACSVCNSPGCDDGIPNDSRLWKVKKATTDVINSFGEVTYALARLREVPAAWSCKRGAWNTATVVNCQGAPVGQGLNRGDILVRFAEDNQQDLLDWLDYCDNWPTRNDCSSTTNLAPSTGCSLCPDCGGSCDKELRGTLGTALGGSMWSVRQYIENEVMPNDPKLGCRPYAAIVLTDGAETCNGDPPARAAELCDIGVPTFVIGFAASTLQADLNAIADAGCEPGCDQHGCIDTAIMVDNEADLTAAFAEIIQGAVLAEVCNGMDDDCDGLIDEDFPGLGERCCAPCAGTVVCNPTGDGTMCSGVPPCPEICDMEDNDCDGLVDEFLNCVYEVCNGLDDDGDGETDELPLPGLGIPCGSDEGECSMGVSCCAQSGNFACCGADAPETEICDCLDNNCNSLTDERVTRACYTGKPSECPDPESGACIGLCRPGAQACVTDTCPTPSYGPCLGEILPRTETCNCLDDDCDGLVDDDVICANGSPCINCNCATLCDPADEFPCPSGLICSGRCAGEVEPYFCRNSPCLGVRCASGFVCDECTGECVDLCADRECGDGRCCGGSCCERWEACKEVRPGLIECVDVSCTNPEFACAEGEVCEDHECVGDPCREVRCAADEACRGGECMSVCPECEPNQRCEQGRCVADECANVSCPLSNTVCCQGTCINDPCVVEVKCDAGEYCDSCTASCREDLCFVTDCPKGYQCRRGECLPRAAVTSEVVVLGAGGCSCRAGPREEMAPLWLCLAIVVVSWRFRRPGRPRR